MLQLLFVAFFDILRNKNILLHTEGVGGAAGGVRGRPPKFFFSKNIFSIHSEKIELQKHM